MRDIALTLFIFGMVPYVLMRPFVGLLVWSWLGYMNPHRLCYGFAYNFPWVMVIAVMTLGSLLASKENKRIPSSATRTLLIVFLLWTGFTTALAVVPDAAWHRWQEFAKTLVLVFSTLMLINSRERMRWLIWIIVVSLGFYGVKGGLFTILRGGSNHVFGPPGSFISDNNDLAQALCMVLPLMRYLQLQAPDKLIRAGLGVAMFFTVVGILGTYSRGGFVALAVVIIALFLKSRRRLTLIVAFAAVGVVAYHLMPTQWMARMDTIQHADQVNSFQTRVQSWEFASNLALHRPLTGGGFNVYESDAMWSRYGPAGAKPRAVHSVYFRVLGEQGLPGICLFLALLAVSWRHCAKVRRQTRREPSRKWAFDLASMFQVCLLAYMTAGLATTSSYFDMTYQIMAMCAVLSALVNAEATASTPHQAQTVSSAGSLVSGRLVDHPGAK
ncbi:putative O-glycosylation ligase, exosortase A system-associated [Oleiagrimonas sp. C23AA]|uniref:putative O-glycosylation ligase, exosortase A system-associated n=1 Tax=Oleiagrimonas sp. C23AA TaxID=2719047 RepID=UPI001421428E|nr:putative O-glycosylation ligase, exosortase A system-associated [Oleiagrimonas sp. C23AA]NII11160.1 putative O-glycosylation ligase, exosortase A system-associated [Oleiagrimonas sp. C23AA]